MKALLVTWLAEWATSPLKTTHVLKSRNMVFTVVPVIESRDDVDLVSDLSNAFDVPSLCQRKP